MTPRATASLLAVAFAGFALGVSVMVLRQPRVCDHVVAVPYERGERPLCVVVRRIEP